MFTSLLRPVILDVRTAKGHYYQTSRNYTHCGKKACPGISKKSSKKDKDIPSPKLATDYPSILHFIVHLPS